MRLYTRGEVKAVDQLVKGTCFSTSGYHGGASDTFMPGFTHLQKAQPVTLAHHVGAYFEMFKRDRERLRIFMSGMNYCPLGSGALQALLTLWIGSTRQSFWALAGPTLKQYGLCFGPGLSD